jgi:hypothetical protein
VALVRSTYRHLRWFKPSLCRSLTLPLLDEMKIKTMLKEAETGHMKKKVEKISSTRVIGTHFYIALHILLRFLFRFFND